MAPGGCRGRRAHRRARSGPWEEVPCRVLRGPRGRARGGASEVVVVHRGPQHPLEMATVPDEDSVCRPRTRVSKLSTNVASRCRTNNLSWAVRSPSAMVRVAGLLGHPFTGRVRAHPAKPHQATLELYERQDVHPGEGNRLDREEVAGEHPGGLARRNSAHAGPLRPGAGPKPWRRRVSRTEVADTLTPARPTRLRSAGSPSGGSPVSHILRVPSQALARLGPSWGAPYPRQKNGG